MMLRKKTFFVLLLLLLVLGASSVRAVGFDVSLDVTEPAPPAPPQVQAGGGNGPPVGVVSDASLPFTITGLSAVPGATSVQVIWQVNRFAEGVIRWGKTQNYELGSFSFLSQKNFDVTLPNLEPATDYFFSIELTDSEGNRTVKTGEKVRTHSLPLILPNVAQFRAIEDDVRIRLEWKNPDISEFASVRIVRSEHFFPAGLDEGKIVYEGRGESALDQEVVPGKIYFYTLFVLGPDGQPSSGAIQQLFFSGPERLEPAFPVKPTIPSAPEQNIPPLSAAITISDFLIREGFSLDTPLSTWEVVEAGSLVTISLPVEKYPTGVRALAITIDDEGVRNSSRILFRLSADKKAFQAVLPIFSDVGGHLFLIELLGQNGEVESNLSGAFVVVEKSVENLASNLRNLWIPIVIILLISVSLFLALFLRKLYTL